MALSMRLLVLIWLGVLMTSTQAGSSVDDDARVRIQESRFVVGVDGHRFVPVGFNYIRLDPSWHATFRPGVYDPDRADAALSHMADTGFNTVRVFLDFFVGRGIVESHDSEALSPKYMDNVCDFIRLAGEHDMRVVVSVLSVPDSVAYRTDPDTGPEFPVGRRNRQLLSEPRIAAKARYMSDVVQYIKQRDQALLASVLSYETENEQTFFADEPPFSLREGELRAANGKTYRASSEAELQQLADDYTVAFANACARAVKEVDTHALVSVNVFTFGAVGRSGPGALHRDRSRDRRFPVRPLALTRSEIDYIDIHFYPFGDDTLQKDLASIEWPILQERAESEGMPLLMGEFGAFVNPYPEEAQAASAMDRHLAAIREIGFAGWLYWTYDTHEQAHLWNAQDGQDGLVLDVLKKHAGSW